MAQLTYLQNLLANTSDAELLAALVYLGRRDALAAIAAGTLAGNFNPVPDSRPKPRVVSRAELDRLCMDAFSIEGDMLVEDAVDLVGVVTSALQGAGLSVEAAPTPPPSLWESVPAMVGDSTTTAWLPRNQDLPHG